MAHLLINFLYIRYSEYNFNMGFISYIILFLFILFSFVLCLQYLAITEEIELEKKTKYLEDLSRKNKIARLTPDDSNNITD